MSDMSRKEAIEVLKDIVSKPMLYSNHIIGACRVALASLETDEAYQLMEEQPKFCEDCISREYVEEMIDRCYAASWNENDFYDRLMAELEVTPSVLPKADKPTIIDWNNCHTPEQLDSIATTKNDLAVEKTDMIDKSNFSQEQYKTDLQSAYDSGYEKAKNDLGVDCISRQAAIDAIRRIHPIDTDYDCTLFDKVDVMYVLNDLPSVTPQEPKSECEHDHAILKAYSDGANEVLDKIDEIITDALDKSTDQKESQTLRWVLDKISEVT